MGCGVVDTVGGYIALFTILIITFCLAAVMSYMLVKRAVRNVIKAFRSHNAVVYQQALTLNELGLAGRTLLKGNTNREFKSMSFRILLDMGIVRPAVDDRFYLSEETLEANSDILS